MKKIIKIYNPHGNRNRLINLPSAMVEETGLDQEIYVSIRNEGETLIIEKINKKQQED
jgi:hypothetical protein